MIEITDGYDLVYKWFDYMKMKGHLICGYVIMPNHLHLIIAFRNLDTTVNKIISNGKRFLAYDMVKRLREAERDNILVNMYCSVSQSDRDRGKIHQVFIPSFDCKPCFGGWFLRQKLTYIHNNPCRGKWHLASSPHLYKHSSAGFYHRGVQGIYEVTHYAEVLR